MAGPPMDSSLFSPLFSDAEISEGFSDAEFVRAMLEVESALATVQGRLGVIPAEAAAQIADASARQAFNFEGLRSGVEKQASR